MLDRALSAQERISTAFANGGREKAASASPADRDVDATVSKYDAMLDRSLAALEAAHKANHSQKQEIEQRDRYLNQTLDALQKAIRMQETMSARLASASGSTAPKADDGAAEATIARYDAMLERGYSTKHKYYYCGDQVTAEPDHVDEGLCRMRYSFPDGSSYTLNMCPIRKNYMRRLLSEAGFERVRTYGDFQETYAEDEPDFFIHVAEKSAEHVARWGGNGADGQADIRDITETYYDSDDADTFYSTIWGGEDLHIGRYETTKNIREASDLSIDAMIEALPELKSGSRVLDLGAGYGGAMRQLVKKTGCEAVCLNISETQNEYNLGKVRAARLAGKIGIRHGVFEDVPEADDSVDVVWSQDAFLHSDQRDQVLAEAFRVLKPGGHLIFTDPMQADDADPAVLQPVYDRLQLNDLGSPRFYRKAAEAIGFETVEQEEAVSDLRTHYFRVREELLANYEKLREAGASAEYLDKMAVGLENWVKAADDGHLAWGVQHFRKPA